MHACMHARAPLLAHSMLHAPCLPLFSAVPGLASLVVAFAPGLPMVMAGRLLYGVGIGFAMHAAPAYIAGVLQAPLRLAACQAACWVVG